MRNRKPTLGRHARNESKSDHPNRWVNVIRSWAPVLGIQGNDLPGQLGSRFNLANTNLKYVVTQKGFALGDATSVSDFAAAEGHQKVRFSHECLYVPKSTSQQSIVGHAESPGNITHDRDLYIDSSGFFVFYIFDGGQKRAISTSSPIVGQPAHIVGTSDGVNIRIYINGALEATTAAGDAFTGYATPEFVFSRGFHGTSEDITGDGSILLFNVYDVALTESQILARYLNPPAPFELKRRPVYRVPAAPSGFIPYPNPRYALAGGMQSMGGGIS